MNSRLARRRRLLVPARDGRRRPPALQHPHVRGGSRLRAVARAGRSAAVPASSTSRRPRRPRPGRDRRCARRSIAPRRRPRSTPAYMPVVHPVVRLRRHDPERGSRRRLPHAAASAAAASTSTTPLVFRDNQPLTNTLEQLPLRSLRTNSTFGWQPQRWVRVEGFYSRLQQSSHAPRRPAEPQSHRIPDRDFQASEDAVMDEPRFDPLDYVSVFNRRKWWFIVPVALAARHRRPAGLEAATHVSGDDDHRGQRRRASPPNMIGTVEIDRQDRMRAVSQQLLSRTVLERTARLEHLDQNQSIDAAVSRLRSGISVSLPDSITPGAAGAVPSQQLSPDQKAQLDTYQVRFVDASPDDAQRIVNRLAQVFVEENSKSREVRAADTSQFIRPQLRASEEPAERARGQAARDRRRRSWDACPSRPTPTWRWSRRCSGSSSRPRRSTRGEQDRLSHDRAADRRHAAGGRRDDRRDARHAGRNRAVARPDAARASWPTRSSPTPTSTPRSSG